MRIRPPRLPPTYPVQSDEWPSLLVHLGEGRLLVFLMAHCHLFGVDEPIFWKMRSNLTTNYRHTRFAAN
jgi:hypothetical protein